MAARKSHFRRRLGGCASVHPRDAVREFDLSHMEGTLIIALSVHRLEATRRPDPGNAFASEACRDYDDRCPGAGTAFADVGIEIAVRATVDGQR